MENSIEEDIILLNDFVEGNFKRDKLEYYKGSYKMGYFYYKDIRQALEHILSDYKKLKEEFKQVDHECERLEEKEVRLIKENEELKNKIMEKELEIIGKEEYIKASMGEIIEQYYTANEECIPVQKIKDKIEEIKQEKKKYGNCLIEMYEDELVNRDIKILQELLESEDSKNGEN